MSLHIRIAICEDEPSHQQDLLRLLESWSSRSGHTIHVRTFLNGTELMGVVDEAYELFDCYILDIAMDNPLEGFEIAGRIRKRHSTLPILIVSSRTELIGDGYDVQAMNFLGKPVKEMRLFTTLDRLADKLSNAESAVYSYTVDGVLFLTPLHEILFVRSDTRDSHYSCINGDSALRFRGRPSDIVEKHPKDFITCHISFAVNIKRVRSFTSNTLILSDYTELPVSRQHVQAVRRLLADILGIGPKRD